MRPHHAAAEETLEPARTGFPLLAHTELARFLDRLMRAESGGRDTARNPRSTAVGPFQFLAGTFLDLVGRHFTAETAGLAPQQILALRTNRDFSRRAAVVFTLENAAVLASAELGASFSNLRLAHLLGATTTVRLLKTAPERPVIEILGAAVVQANPFMAGMRAADLVAWADRDMGTARSAAVAVPPGRIVALAGTQQAPAPPRIVPRCNLQLASCKKWLALARKQAARPARVAAVTAKRIRPR